MTHFLRLLWLIRSNFVLGAFHRSVHETHRHGSFHTSHLGLLSTFYQLNLKIRHRLNQIKNLPMQVEIVPCIVLPVSFSKQLELLGIS